MIELPYKRTEILQLYRNILKSTKRFKLTDPIYIRSRIIKEFKYYSLINNPIIQKKQVLKAKMFLKSSGLY